MRIHRVLVCSSLLALAACETESTVLPEPDCDLVALSALMVGVQDSVSGAGIAAGSTIVVKDGAFVDSLVVAPNRTDLNNAQVHPANVFERAGTYDITVRRSGYATWTRSGVSVTRGRCHVQTVSVTARLQPLCTP